MLWLDRDTPFPDPETALDEPNGLLAAGADLSAARLINAYQNGIFPWFNEGDPILWWSPDPRAVIYPHTFKPSRSLQKTINKQIFSITHNTAFEKVIHLCARTRQTTGTWINQEMIDAYIELHRLGFAHSFETWHHHQLVGGLYGLWIGKVFCGESMFSLMTDASKIALVRLVRFAIENELTLIDCQLPNPHLMRLGAQCLSRHDFLKILKRGLQSD